MDIDFIKWMVGYAEGFEIIPKPFHEDDCECIEHKGVEHYDIDDLEDVAWWSDGFKYIIYPLLLQRAIEGINKGEDFEIMQTRSNIIVYPKCKAFELEPDNEIEAKEQALKYIWEKESL